VRPSFETKLDVGEERILEAFSFALAIVVMKRAFAEQSKYSAQSSPGIARAKGAKRFAVFHEVVQGSPGRTRPREKRTGCDGPRARGTEFGSPLKPRHDLSSDEKLCGFFNLTIFGIKPPIGGLAVVEHLLYL